MNWLLSSIGALILWGLYSIFGDKATQVHGERISFLFEASAMVILAVTVFLLWGNFQEFKKITAFSAMNASVMAFMTSGAAFLVLLAFRLAPNTHTIPQIVLIAGFYPVVTAITSYFFLDARLSTTQWIGVALSAVALFLINWKS
jgi:drug/metabolite transporter (DMT)-like permease